MCTVECRSGRRIHQQKCSKTRTQKVSQDSKHGKKKEQQDLKDVVSDNNNPWPGLNDFGD